MSHSSSAPSASSSGADWRAVVRKYQQPSVRKAAGQIANTFLPYLGCWVLMYLAAQISLWLILPLAILAGLFFVRLFIIFHDCTHGSFFASKRANELLGTLTGVLTFTSFHHWRWEHNTHHAHTGNLDRRGIGDVWTLTVQEYLDASWWTRFRYKINRNPVILFLIAPLVLFLIINRLPVKGAGKRERQGLHLTNFLIVAMLAGLVWVFGWPAFLMAQGVSLAVATGLGVWLFYVQHQFEDVYWDRKDDWDFVSAAIEGSSFYKLPRVLQWFTGNIGFHHIHHLSPRIPNYELERAHHAEPFFQQVRPMTLRTSLKSFSFRLWDETTRTLTGYQLMRQRRREQARAATQAPVSEEPAEASAPSIPVPLPRLT